MDSYSEGEERRGRMRRREEVFLETSVTNWNMIEASRHLCRIYRLLGGSEMFALCSWLSLKSTDANPPKY